MDLKTKMKLAALSGFALSSVKLGDGKVEPHEPAKDKVVAPIVQAAPENLPDITITPEKTPQDTLSPQVFMEALNNPIRPNIPSGHIPPQTLPTINTPEKSDPLADFKEDLNEDCQDYIELYNALIKGKGELNSNEDKGDLLSDGTDLRINLLVNNDLIPALEVVEKVGAGMGGAIDAMQGVDPNSAEGQAHIKEIQKAGKKMAASIQKDAKNVKVNGDQELMDLAAWGLENDKELGEDVDNKRVDNFLKSTYKKAKTYCSDYAHSIKEKGKSMTKSFSLNDYMKKGRE